MAHVSLKIYNLYKCDKLFKRAKNEDIFYDKILSRAQSKSQSSPWSRKKHVQIIERRKWLLVWKKISWNEMNRSNKCSEMQQNAE